MDKRMLSHFLYPVAERIAVVYPKIRRASRSLVLAKPWEYGILSKKRESGRIIYEKRCCIFGVSGDVPELGGVPKQNIVR